MRLTYNKFCSFIIASIILILFSLFPKNISADAACGDGWFCGINQGYFASVDRSAKTCFMSGITWLCSNNGTWICNGLHSCVAGSGGSLCSVVSTNAVSCQITARANPDPACTLDRCYNACDINAALGTCKRIKVPYTTGCCVKEAAPTNTPPPAPTNTPPPAPTSAPPSCASWTEAWINNCTPNSTYVAGDPDCDTTSRDVTVRNTVSADEVRYVNTDPAVFCSAAPFSGGYEARNATKSWTLTSGLGEKKVCAEFRNTGNPTTARCGGMIRYVNVTPVPTVPPPTPAPIVPNCSNVSGPGSRLVGQPGNYCADFYSPGATLQGEINVLSPFEILRYQSGLTPGGDSFCEDWTPSSAGNYDICCRGWNDGIAECRPPAMGGIGGVVYACAGPNYCRSVNVTQADGFIQGRRISDEAGACVPEGTNTSITINCPGFNETDNLNGHWQVYGTSAVIPLGTSCTVSVNEPAGSEAYYSLCDDGSGGNCISHPAGSYTKGNSINVTIPNQNAPGYWYPYVDLYWQWLCPAAPTVVPTVGPTVPPPVVDCTINLIPGSLSLNPTDTSTLAAFPLSQVGGTIQEVRFTTSNSLVASISPLTSYPPSFTTDVTAGNTGNATITARGYMLDGGSLVQKCSDTSSVSVVPGPTSPPPPSDTPVPPSNTPVPPTVAPCSCTANLFPDPTSLNIGETATMTTSVIGATCAVDEVRYTSANPSIATATSPDTTPVYTTSVTGVASGSTTVTTQVIMGGVSRCSDTATVAVAATQCVAPARPVDPPAPWCQLDGTWSNTWQWNAVWDPDAGDWVTAYRIRVDDQPVRSWPYIDNPGWLPAGAYGCAAGGRCSHTTNNLVSGQPYYSWIQARGACTQSAWSSRAEQTHTCAECSFNLSNVTVVGIGGTNPGRVIAPIVETGGFIDTVSFTSGNPSVATVTSPDPDPSFTTEVTGVSIGSTTYSAIATMDDGVTTCSNTNIATISVTNPNPWWQAVKGDVVTNGNLVSPIPVSCDLSPTCDAVLITYDSVANDSPGVASYNAGVGLGVGEASQPIPPYGWLGNSQAQIPANFGYQFFEDKLEDNVLNNWYEFTSSNIDQITLNQMSTGAIGTTIDGYDWYHYDGALGTLTFDGNLSLVGTTRKIVVFVENANLEINGTIRVEDGESAFMVVVGGSSGGDILIDSSVGGGVGPHLEGIFISDGDFVTGAGNSQLHVRGSVVALGSVVLLNQRDLDNNSELPAEIFEYGVDQVLLYPDSLTPRRLIWEEVAP